MIDWRTGYEVGRRVISVARREQLTLLAAGVAYYGFVSLVPLTLLGLVVATAVGGDMLAIRATTLVSDLLSPSAQTLLADAITEESGRGGATIVGVFALLWSGSRVFRGLDRAFSQIYATVGEQGIVGDFGDAAVVLLAITLAFLVAGALEAALSFQPIAALELIAPLLVQLSFVLAFWPLYVVFPDAPVSVREAFPGTVLAAVGWFALSRTFSVYAGLAGTYALYGALGAVLLVLAWLYVGSVLIVLGAVLNAVLAERVADRQLQSPGGRQVRSEAMTDEATGDDESTESLGSARTRDRAEDPDVLREEIQRLRDELERFEEEVEGRTVEKESLESELKRYVRRRMRRGHARGWGPYIVLLYGTALALGAFYLLSGGWAILAMFVVWTSTLGVYVLMVLVETGISVLGLPGRLRDAISSWRS